MTSKGETSRERKKSKYLTSSCSETSHSVTNNNGTINNGVIKFEWLEWGNIPSKVETDEMEQEYEKKSFVFERGRGN